MKSAIQPPNAPANRWAPQHYQKTTPGVTMSVRLSWDGWYWEISSMWQIEHGPRQPLEDAIAECEKHAKMHRAVLKEMYMQYNKSPPLSCNYDRAIEAAERKLGVVKQSRGRA